MNKKTIIALSMLGGGIIGWNMYKMKNPEVVEEMKCMARDAATKMLEKVENMD